jgi:hypothetical protein
VAQDPKRIPPARCPGDPHNCERLLSSQEAYHERYGKAENRRAVLSLLLEHFEVGIRVIEARQPGVPAPMQAGAMNPRPQYPA